MGQEASLVVAQTIVLLLTEKTESIVTLCKIFKYSSVF